MSAYDQDPRVEALGGDVWAVHETEGGTPAGVVKIRPGGEVSAAVPGGPFQPHPTVDDAIRSLIGDPQ